MSDTQNIYQIEKIPCSVCSLLFTTQNEMANHHFQEHEKPLPHNLTPNFKPSTPIHLNGHKEERK